MACSILRSQDLEQQPDRRCVTEFFPIERRSDRRPEEIPTESESDIEMERRLS